MYTVTQPTNQREVWLGRADHVYYFMPDFVFIGQAAVDGNSETLNFKNFVLYSPHMGAYHILERFI